jgi:ATP-dependent exoDNAse (exonuclease V) beta subunit
MVEGEIISATKLSVYKQCPLKYHLTYNLGYDLLNNQFKKWRIEKKDTTLYEFNENEDENLKGEEEKTLRDHNKEFGVVKGRIIHKILQDEVSFAELDRVVNNLLDIQQELFEVVEKIKNELMIEIINDLKAFYNSEAFKELMEFKYHENEFEIYAMENDYYLFGIIDRLIFEHDKVIIIDYKTDEATESELKEKVKIYFKQLDFYSYILSKFYNNNIKFELRLVFIKYPEKVFMKEAAYNDFEKIELDIQEMVKKLREKSGYGMPSHFNKNLDHCNSCSYSPDHHNCVVK